MISKTLRTIGWILTVILAIVFLGSAFIKFSGAKEALQNAAVYGFTPFSFRILGSVEVLSFVLFLFPRTGLLGTLLCAAYLGGAMATHLEHQQSILLPTIIQCLLWITAVIRFPELSVRLLNI